MDEKFKKYDYSNEKKKKLAHFPLRLIIWLPIDIYFIS